MPDKRVETWESKLYKADLEELSLWTEEDQDVIVCLSPMSRNVLLDMVGFSLRWPRRWRANKSSLPGTVPEDVILQIVEKIEQELIMTLGCGDDLTRIAVAVEGLQASATEALEFVDSQYISLSEFISFLDLAGLGKFQPWLDAAGEIVELLNVIPDINIRVPMGGAIAAGLTFFTNIGFRNRLENINKSLQSISLGQSGPGIQDAIDALLSLVPDSLETIGDTVAGPVDEIVSTVGIDLLTLLSKNYMTARTNDVARALNGGDYDIFGDSNVVEAINALEATSTTNAGTIGSAIEGIETAVIVEGLSVIANQIARLAERPECGCPAGGTEEDSPPTDDPIEVGDDGYPEQSDLDAYRCKAAYLTWEALRSFWFKMAAYSIDEITGYTLATMAGIIVGALVISGVGIPIAAIAGAMIALASKILQTVSFSAGDIVDFLDDRQADIICALFSGPDEDAARSAVQAVMDDFGTLTSLEEEAIMLMLANSFISRIYTEDIRILTAPDPEYDCSDCFGADACPWTIYNGTGSPRYDGVEWTISSENIGGGVHFAYAFLVTSCVSINWCVIFTQRSAMNNTSINYSRTLNSNANGVPFYNTEQFDYNHDPADCFPDLNIEYPISAFSFANNAAFTVGIRFIKKVTATDFDPSQSTACDE